MQCLKTVDTERQRMLSFLCLAGQYFVKWYKRQFLIISACFYAYTIATIRESLLFSAIPSFYYYYDSQNVNGFFLKAKYDTANECFFK